MGKCTCRRLPREDGQVSRQSVPFGQLVMQYPMYAVRAVEFLKMTEVRPHQVLRVEGLAVEYETSRGVAVFVSHQWCSRASPDPDYAQLKVLQAVLQRIVLGTLRIDVDMLSLVVFKQKATVTMKDLAPLATGYIWYDYFSVPQPEAPQASYGHSPPRKYNRQPLTSNVSTR